VQVKDGRVSKRKDPWMRRAFTPGEDDARSFIDRQQWAKEGDKLDADDRLWKQYVVLVDLYKYYLEVAWKVAVWYYATTGAVLAYYFDNVEEGPSRTLPFLLVFLALISLGFAYLQWRGARNLSSIPQLLEHIARTLRLPGRPHVEFAVVFLLMNSAMLVAVSLGCLALFFSAFRWGS
jgi:hypothetical protein